MSQDDPRKTMIEHIGQGKEWKLSWVLDLLLELGDHFMESRNVGSEFFLILAINGRCIRTFG